METEPCQSTSLTRQASDVNDFNMKGALTLGSGFQSTSSAPMYQLIRLTHSTPSKVKFKTQQESNISRNNLKSTLI